MKSDYNKIMLPKHFVLITFFLLLQTFLHAQATHQIIFEKKYSDLPFKIRIENSGNYSVASFDVNGDSVFFSSFNSNFIFKYSKNILENKTSIVSGEIDVVKGIVKNEIRTLNRKSHDKSIEPNQPQKKIFYNNPEIVNDRGGILSNMSGVEIIKVKVDSKDRLIIEAELAGLFREAKLDFPSNLACADFIGIDGDGNSFLLVETYLSQIPLQIKREVYSLSKEGLHIGTLQLPSDKFIYTLKDLQIDSDGNLFHLYSDENGIKIFKWIGIANSTSSIKDYPQEYAKPVVSAQNRIVEEPQTQKILGINTPASRVTALKIGESYALHQYSCSVKNLSPQNVSAPDGDIVRTPSWLVEGKNARVAYMWGGFSSLAQYDAGLASGKYAADINTAGVSSYAVGVDCSGFVSRCWQMSYHSSTSMMPDITTQYSSWNDLKPGDAIHKVGHVRLFVNRTPDGKFRVVESSARGWDVSYWSYLASDLTTYTPRYYNNMENESNSNQPALNQALSVSGGNVSLKWNCDTTNILGFRIYKSDDGINFQIAVDENSCKTNEAQITVSNGVSYFRIASVKNTGGVLSESFWSNSMGVGNSFSKKCLIVDGYKRLEGSWRGAGHTFAAKYGIALHAVSQNFETVSNTQILDSTVYLNDYDAVFWISGDESTIDETFSHSEQILIKNYLEAGGNLFVSGSEIGWDLSYKGDTADKDFYKNYFKAVYVSDDAGSSEAKGILNTLFDSCQFYFGQTYEEDYPDEINPTGGSAQCLQFANGKGAGLQYAGSFGSSNKVGKIIYLSFPLETTADDSAFNNVVSRAVTFFNSPASTANEEVEQPNGFSLNQNYPNPFNPTTTLRYSVLGNRHVSLKVFDVLGNEIAILVNENKVAGSYQVNFSSTNLASGTYIYTFQAGAFVQSKKMILLK